MTTDRDSGGRRRTLVFLLATLFVLGAGSGYTYGVLTDEENVTIMINGEVANPQGAVGVEGTPTPVEERAESFAVALSSSDSAVSPGETVTLTVTVTNTWEQRGTQDVAIAVQNAQDGTVASKERELTLDAGESGTLTLDWETENAVPDLSPYTVTARSGGDSESIQVTVERTDREQRTDATNGTETTDGQQRNTTEQAQRNGEDEDRSP